VRPHRAPHHVGNAPLEDDVPLTLDPADGLLHRDGEEMMIAG
jgi:hypothetical protein